MKRYIKCQLIGGTPPPSSHLTHFLPASSLYGLYEDAMWLIQFWNMAWEQDRDRGEGQWRTHRPVLEPRNQGKPDIIHMWPNETRN